MKAFVTTLPKSGTHLLNVVLQEFGLTRHPFDASGAAGLLSSNMERARISARFMCDTVDAMPQNSFLLHHLPHTNTLMRELIKRDVRPIALIRNPYDFIVSLAHHFLAHPESDTPRDLSLHAMQHWICGGRDGEAEAPIAKRYIRMMNGWIEDERTLILRFEEIVGSLGGGQFSNQLAAGLSLRDFLGLEKSPSDVVRAFITGFQPDLPMFRRGQIGSWKEEMAANTAQQVRLLYGWLFEKWGYTLEGNLVREARTRDGIFEQMDKAAAGLVAHNHHLRLQMRAVVEEIKQIGAASAATGKGDGC